MLSLGPVFSWRPEVVNQPAAAYSTGTVGPPASHFLMVLVCLWQPREPGEELSQQLLTQYRSEYLPELAYQVANINSVANCHWQA